MENHSTWSKKSFNVGLSLLLLICLGALPGTVWAQKLTRISIGTAQIGGSFFIFGGAAASVISKYIPGVEATAEVTNGSVDNAKFLSLGKIDLGLITSDVGYPAYTGTGAFKEKIPLRNLFTIDKSIIPIVCMEGSGINSVTDLKGKRVSTGTPGSAVEVVANRILEAYGIDPAKDIKRERLNMTQSADALKDGKIDAFFSGGSIMIPALQELASTPGVKLKFIDHGKIVSKVVEKYGKVYTEATIPANTYRGIDHDVSTLGLLNYLTCSEKMDENLVYNILKVLFEHKAEIEAIHPMGKSLTLKTAVKDCPFPYHPGAIKYYKEKGLSVASW